MELIPRITRAQSMDVLSSMATIAGYKAVLLAADRLPKMFPMMMTAAGTLTPAKVFVIGAGVAGLQAIASAKRLGAVVQGYDVRPAVKEQVESLGAKFVEMPLATGDAEGAGGYAKQLDEEFYRKQRELMAQTVAGKRRLHHDGRDSRQEVAGAGDGRRGARHGAGLGDRRPGGRARRQLRAHQGRTRSVVENGVTILGPTNLPSEVPAHASQMYAKNLTNFVALISRDGKVHLNLEDQVVRETLAAHRGEVVQSAVARTVEFAAAGDAAARQSAGRSSGQQTVDPQLIPILNLNPDPMTGSRRQTIRVPAFDLPGVGSDSPRVAAAAHAADVAHQRHLGDRGRGGDSSDQRGRNQFEHRARHAGRHRGDRRTSWAVSGSPTACSRCSARRRASDQRLPTRLACWPPSSHRVDMRTALYWGSYLAAAALFILSLKWLSHPRTARRGVLAGEIGMALAVIGTLLIFHVGLKWVLIGIVLGSLIGAPMAIWMPMTAVPQRTALSHAFGALAAALVGIAHYYEPHGGTIDRFTMGVLGLEVLLGCLTFTGSLVAFGKLQELIPSSIKGLAAAESHQLRAARRGGPVLPVAHLQSRTLRRFPAADPARAGVRRRAGDADRRGRHADGDLAVEFVRRPVGELDGLRARQLSADRGRGARRFVRPDPVDHHVQGDEPLVHQRAVRADGREHRRVGRRSLRRQGEVGHAPKTSPWCSTACGAWWSCPATEWPSPRRSTRSANCSTSSRAAARKSSLRFIPSPAGCRDT